MKQHLVKDEPTFSRQEDAILYRLKDHHWHFETELELIAKTKNIQSELRILIKEGNDILGMFHPDRKRVYMYRLRGSK